MARFSVQMTLASPVQQRHHRVTTLLQRGGTARYDVADGRIAVSAMVRAESAADAALQLCRAVEREESMRGRGPVRVLSWTATRSVPVLAGLGRRRRRWSGTEWSGWDDEGGTAGVREPRRPKPSPGALSAALDPPQETEGRFPA